MEKKNMNRIFELEDLERLFETYISSKINVTDFNNFVKENIGPLLTFYDIHIGLKGTRVDNCPEAEEEQINSISFNLKYNEYWVFVTFDVLTNKIVELSCESSGYDIDEDDALYKLLNESYANFDNYINDKCFLDILTKLSKEIIDRFEFFKEVYNILSYINENKS